MRRLLVVAVVVGVCAASTGAVWADSQLRSTCMGFDVTIDMADLPPGEPAVGTDRRDVILGTDAGDVIVGRGGDDVICGGDGDDNIRGGPDHDLIDTGAGDDIARGGPGNDVVHGGWGNDFINGGIGHDEVYGDEGNDGVIGGPGNDLIDGGLGDDGDPHNPNLVLLGQSGVDTIHGGPGNDLIRGGAGNDVINGDDGHDRIYGGGGSDLIGGDDGNDVIVGNNGWDTIYGGDGNDVIEGLNQADTLYGGAGDDDISGGAYGDTIYGRTGNDILAGGPGDDTIEGNEGNDDLDGGDGTDTLNGGDGTDVCTTGETLISCETTDRQWATHFGSPITNSQSDRGSDVAVDDSGNTYVTGSFKGTADFDDGSGTYELGPCEFDCAFAVKLDPTGDLVWAAAFGDPSQIANGLGVATDSLGYSYFTGWFRGTADFDPGPGVYELSTTNAHVSGTYGPLVPTYQSYVVKLSPSGDLVWAVTFANAELDDLVVRAGDMKNRAGDIAVNGSMNVYVSGYFEGAAVDFDPGPGVSLLTNSSNVVEDGYLVKLSPAGQLEWAGHFPGGSTGGHVVPYRLALDAMGNILVSGEFANSADLDPGAGVHELATQEWTSGFVVKVNPSGDLVWAAQFAGPGGQTASHIAVGDAGNILVGGWFFSEMDADPGPFVHNLISNGQIDVFVLKLDQFGDLLWANNFGGWADEWPRALAVNPFGETFCSWGGNLTKLDAFGNEEWTRPVASSPYTQAWGIAADEAGSLYLTGGFSGTQDFDPGPGELPLTSYGGGDAFVVKIVE